MAPLAYVLLPISGMLAYFLAPSSRVRFHGAQAVALGAAWPAALYLSSYLASALTQLVFLIGAVVWIGLIITSAAGRDYRLPVVGPMCARAGGLEES